MATANIIIIIIANGVNYIVIFISNISIIIGINVSCTVAKVIIMIICY